MKTIGVNLPSRTGHSETMSSQGAARLRTTYITGVHLAWRLWGALRWRCGALFTRGGIGSRLYPLFLLLHRNRSRPALVKFDRICSCRGRTLLRSFLGCFLLLRGLCSHEILAPILVLLIGYIRHPPSHWIHSVCLQKPGKWLTNCAQ